VALLKGAKNAPPAVTRAGFGRQKSSQFGDMSFNLATLRLSDLSDRGGGAPTRIREA